MSKSGFRVKYLIILCFLLGYSNISCSLGYSNKEKLVVVGSTTMLPLSERLATTYKKDVGVDVIVQGGGSNAGIFALSSDIAQIAASSRKFTEKEKESFDIFPVAHDILAFVVHPSNPINDLSLEQLRDILSGKITSWKELGAPFDKPIQIINASPGNGSRIAIEELVMGKSREKKIDGIPMTLMSVITNSSPELKANVADLKYSIGYLPFNFLDSTVKALSIDNIPPTYAAAYKGRYPLFRDLFYAIKKGSSGLELAYIYYVLSPEGQDLVTQEGLLPINLITSIEQLDKIVSTRSKKRKSN